MNTTSSFKTSKLFLFSLLLLIASCSTELVETVEESEELSAETAKGRYGEEFVRADVTTALNVDLRSASDISPLIYGVNNDWRRIPLGRYSGFQQRLNGINYELVRYPGGFESEFYDWSENRTPGWRNTPATPGADVGTVKRSNTGALSIVVPIFKAMVEEQWSPEWFAAIQELKAEADDAINMTGPNEITSVEIGNEWWLQFGGQGVNRPSKLRKYAHIAKRIARHIKTRFPNANFKLLVNGDYTEPQEFSVINTVFGADIDDIDGLTLHTYTCYESESHNIRELQNDIDACQANLGKNYLSLSEWAPSKAYNEGKVYAEGANLLVEQMYEHALAEADEAAFWPPTNNAIPGLGLFNLALTQDFPTAQLFGDMAQDFRGEVLDVKDGTVRGAAARKANGDIVVYVTGKQERPTTVSINFNGTRIARIVSATMWEPGNLSNTAQAVPMNKIDDPVVVRKNKRILFNINENSSYTIMKVVLRLR